MTRTFPCPEMEAMMSLEQRTNFHFKRLPLDTLQRVDFRGQR